MIFENLIFSLDATVPLFLVMLLGLVFKNIGLFDENFLKRMNNFVFKAALPAALFYDLAEQDFFEVWDTSFVLFCFFVTLICIAVSILIAKYVLRDNDLTGEFAQASYRSSAAILGIGFIENIYGNAGMVPLMIAAAVPLYNIMAVVVLTVFKPGGDGRLTHAVVMKTLKGIVTNPIIIGIVIGTVWSVGKLPQPVILMKTVRYLGNTSTPLGLMAVGAAFDIKAACGRIKPSAVAVTFKLVIWSAIFLPLAIHMGFTHDKLVSILIMLGSPTTASSFIMAKTMGHEGVLTSSAIMMTTFLSAFTMTGWIFILRAMGLI